MSSLEVRLLQERLIKKFQEKGTAYARRRAGQLVQRMSNIGNQWLKDIRARMSTPASLRNGRPHNSSSYNDNFPMMISGKLKSMLRFKATVHNVPTGAVVSVNYHFNRALNKNGLDYGEILNQGGKNNRNRNLKGYKERAYGMLEDRIRKALHE